MLSSSVKENVFQFQIPMYNLLLMQISNRFNYFCEYCFYLVFFDDALSRHLPYILIQIATIYIFNYEGYLVPAVDCVVKFHYAGVGKLTHNTNLLLKALYPVIAFCQFMLIVLFYGHFFLRLQYPSSLHNAICSLAQQYFVLVFV